MEVAKLNTKDMKGSASEQPVLSFKAQKCLPVNEVSVTIVVERMRPRDVAIKTPFATNLIKLDTLLHYVAPRKRMLVLNRSHFPINEDHLRLIMSQWGLIFWKNRKCFAYIK